MYLNSSISKILGVLFYYPPSTDIARSVLPILPELSELLPESIEALLPQLTHIDPQSLTYDYSVLFEGQGTMPAPPWGSYYLDVDQLLMGESTLAFRNFLHANDLSLINEHQEPEDQFGLVLMALALLLDKNAIEQAKVLLSDCLLPWAFEYLQHVQNAPLEHNFYPTLAQMSEIYLRTLQQTLNLKPA